MAEDASLDDLLIEAYRRGYKARQGERDYDPGEATDLAEGWLAAHDAQGKAEAWDEALHTLWQLNDPASTIAITPDRALLTEADVKQTLAENPYRAADPEATR